MFRSVFLLALLFVTSSLAFAHDTWLETNTNLVRLSDRVDIDVKLGNHGNEHRDFKLASKVALEGISLHVIGPSGKKIDVKPELVDLGYTPKEGYWSAPYVSKEAGLHLAVSTSDQVMNHGSPQRSIKSAKVIWLVDRSLDKPTSYADKLPQALGLPFELVLLTDPVMNIGPEKPIEVKLLRHGKPVVGEVVSFIPRGTELTAGFDANYERKTNTDGVATFTPKEGNVYLIVAHQLRTDEKTADYVSTKYSATLTLRLPQICPCCAE